MKIIFRVICFGLPVIWLGCTTMATNTIKATGAVRVNGNQVQASPLTDGDIRRGLIRGLTLESPIETIVFRNPIVVPPNMGADLLLHLMEANKVHQLPVIDEHRTVVGLHLWHDLVSPGKLPNVMVIMAGGEGARLRPMTASVPKPMLEVAGRPLIETMVTQLVAQGIRRILISVRYLAQQVEDHFGAGEQFGCRIDFLCEKEPLGTAGALRLLPETPTDPLLVINGDLLTEVRFDTVVDYHVQNGFAATVGIREFKYQVPHGVVQIDDHRVVSIDEKPTQSFFINAGIYVLEPRIIPLIPEGAYTMPELLADLHQPNDCVGAFPIPEYWLDIGRLEDYEAAQAHFAAQGSS